MSEKLRKGGREGIRKESERERNYMLAAKLASKGETTEQWLLLYLGLSDKRRHDSVKVLSGGTNKPIWASLPSIGEGLLTGV